MTDLQDQFLSPESHIAFLLKKGKERLQHNYCHPSCYIQSFHQRKNHWKLPNVLPLYKLCPRRQSGAQPNTFSPDISIPHSCNGLQVSQKYKDMKPWHLMHLILQVPACTFPAHHSYEITYPWKSTVQTSSPAERYWNVLSLFWYYMP